MERVRPLLRVRQVREFSAEPVTTAELEAIAETGRWSGSSRNEQPWRFIVIRDEAAIRRIAEAGLPQTRSLRTAPAAIAIVLPDDPGRAVSYAYDEGRAAERMLTAASFLDLGAGIAWVRPDVLPVVRTELDLPDDRLIRTILSVGHPTDAARRAKSAPGEARRPRDEAIFEERWPDE
jgi:nitroreductase